MIDLNDINTRQFLIIGLLLVFIAMDVCLFMIAFDYKESCQDRCLNLTEQVKGQCMMWRYSIIPDVDWERGNLTLEHR